MENTVPLELMRKDGQDDMDPQKKTVECYVVPVDLWNSTFLKSLNARAPTKKQSERAMRLTAAMNLPRTKVTFIENTSAAASECPPA
jgi:hypothetical protein